MLRACGRELAFAEHVTMFGVKGRLKQYITGLHVTESVTYVSGCPLLRVCDVEKRFVGKLEFRWSTMEPVIGRN